MISLDPTGEADYEDRLSFNDIADAEEALSRARRAFHVNPTDEAAAELRAAHKLFTLLSGGIIECQKAA